MVRPTKSWDKTKVGIIVVVGHLPITHDVWRTLSQQASHCILLSEHVALVAVVEILPP